MKADVRWMERALGLAQSVLGTTAPNPAVGAVLVRGDAVIGEGATQPAGGAHAEVMALADCSDRGEDPAGCTIYVTLEPCCHHGRTGPCTDALLAAGVSRVVIGVVDPDRRVRGRGIDRLREAGLQVDVGVLDQECSRQVRGFAKVVHLGLPEVTCKVGASLDGHIATAEGKSQWITGAEARQDGHVLRASHDAVMVGAGTLRADNPRLTARIEGAVQPTRVILDSKLSIAVDAAVFGDGAVVVVCTEDAPERDLPCEVIRVPGSPAGVDLDCALRALAKRDLHRVLVEGGGILHRSLLDGGFVDGLVSYVAGKLIPGGRPMVGGPPVSSLDAFSLTLHSVEQIGADAKLTWDVSEGPCLPDS